MQKKISKKLKYDVTKEGKIDISFLRVEKTAEEIDYLEPNPLHYFFIQIARNGFYHPKKIYNVFYQEDFYQKDQKRRPGGVSFTSTFETPKGDIFMPLSLIFMKQAMKDTEELVDDDGRVIFSYKNEKRGSKTNRVLRCKIKETDYAEV